MSQIKAPTTVYYATEIKDVFARKIEKLAHTVASIATEAIANKCDDYVIERLENESKSLHVTAIQQQLQINASTKAARKLEALNIDDVNAQIAKLQELKNRKLAMTKTE